MTIQNVCPFFLWFHCKAVEGSWLFLKRRNSVVSVPVKVLVLLWMLLLGIWMFIHDNTEERAMEQQDISNGTLLYCLFIPTTFAAENMPNSILVCESFKYCLFGTHILSSSITLWLIFSLFCLCIGLFQFLLAFCKLTLIFLLPTFPTAWFPLKFQQTEAHPINGMHSTCLRYIGSCRGSLLPL